jgi:hypothetical protein
MSKKTYMWRKTDGEDAYCGGFKPTDILVQHYNDPGMRTTLLRKDEFENLKPWELCSILNEVYESGRRDAMEDLRKFIGLKE